MLDPQTGTSIPVSYTHLHRLRQARRDPGGNYRSGPSGGRRALYQRLEGRFRYLCGLSLIHIYYDYFGEDRTVDTHVKMLRGHLGKCRGYIATFWGIGYKFDPDAAR